MEFPKFPRHLSPDERRAVLMEWARDAAAETLRETGIDPARVRVEEVVATAAATLEARWLAERVGALEAAQDVQADTARDAGADLIAFKTRLGR